MLKQSSIKIKKVLAILLAVLFVVSMTIAAVNAWFLDEKVPATPGKGTCKEQGHEVPDWFVTIDATAVGNG